MKSQPFQNFWHRIVNLFPFFFFFFFKKKKEKGLQRHRISYSVSKVLERLAATFAGVLEGDILLQIDDRVVSMKDDILSSLKDDLLRYFLCLFFPFLPIYRGGGHTSGPRSFHSWWDPCEDMFLCFWTSSTSLHIEFYLFFLGETSLYIFAFIETSYISL
jgi:hypothetical protein